MTQRSLDIQTTSNFRSTFAVTIEVNKYNEAKSLSRIGNFQIFVTFFAHSTTTPINIVCLDPLRPSCGHCVKSTFLLRQPNEFKFKLKHEAIQYLCLFKFCDFTILMNLIQKTGLKPKSFTCFC